MNGANHTPRVLLKVDGDVLDLSPGTQRVLLRALMLFERSQQRRVDEALAAGEPEHAYQRSRTRARVLDILHFLEEAGCQMPTDYVRPELGAPPPRDVSGTEKPNG